MEADKLVLTKYRMEKARECLLDAKKALEENRLANSINRSYYSMFHATRALLAMDCFDSKKHSSIIGYFNQYYIAIGKIDHSYHQMLANSFRVRNKTDYDDFYVVSKDEAIQQLDNAGVFTEFMEKYITNNAGK